MEAVYDHADDEWQGQMIMQQNEEKRQQGRDTEIYEMVVVDANTIGAITVKRACPKGRRNGSQMVYQERQKTKIDDAGTPSVRICATALFECCALALSHECQVITQ